MEPEPKKTTVQEPIPQPKNACETLSEVIQSRRKYRSLLFHILYAVDALNYETSALEVAEKISAEYDIEIDVNGTIISTVNAIASQRSKLDQEIIPHLQNWKFERIGKCTLLVLRYAIWELLNTNTPHNIILNEAIELAKCFSERDAYKFVNGILDKISAQLQKNAKEEEEEEESTS